MRDVRTDTLVGDVDTLTGDGNEILDPVYPIDGESPSGIHTPVERH